MSCSIDDIVNHMCGGICGIEPSKSWDSLVEWITIATRRAAILCRTQDIFGGSHWTTLYIQWLQLLNVLCFCSALFQPAAGLRWPAYTGQQLKKKHAPLASRVLIFNTITHIALWSHWPQKKHPVLTKLCTWQHINWINIISSRSSSITVVVLLLLSYVWK